MSNRCQHCGTGDHCQCCLDHIGQPCIASEKPNWRDDPVERKKFIGRVRHHLEHIPDLAALLPLFVNPARRSSDSLVMSSTFGSQPPMDLGVVDLLDEREKSAGREGVRPALISWARVYDDALDGTVGYETPWRRQACAAACSFSVPGFTLVPAAEHGPCVGDLRQHAHVELTVASACSYLIRWLDRVAEYQWFDEFANDVRKMRGEMKSVTGDRSVEDLRLACTGCGWNRIESMDGGKWFRCTGCDLSWPEAELSKRAERDRPRSIKDAAKEAGVSLSTLRRLIADGRLAHVGADGSKRLFAMADVRVALLREKLAEPAAG